jgi:hypothetical protein
LFPLGRTLITPGAAEASAKAKDDPVQFFKRHVSGDWGDVSEADKRANWTSLTEGTRLFSVYRLSDGTCVYLITEADRSCTTLILPDEY